MTLYIKAVDSSVSALSLHNQVKNLNEQRELSKLCELKNEVGTLAPADEKRYRSLRRQDYGLLIWHFWFILVMKNTFKGLSKWKKQFRLGF